MIIGGLDAGNFRNLEKISLEFSDTFNFVTGENAQGKTNLLEAIHFFSIGRSFRTRRTDELVSFDEDYFFIRLKGRSDSGIDFRLEIGYERGGRAKASVNGKTLSTLSEVIGIMPTVLFTPADVGLSAGPPAGRRVYLDYTAAQISPAFLEDLKEYRRIVRHRNRLLKRISCGGRDGGELEAWNAMMVDKGTAVARGRREILGLIGAGAGAIYSEIRGGGERLEMEYRSSYNPEGINDRRALEEALARSGEAEKRRGYTLAGPHYDDLAIFLGGTDLKRYGSQGRKRLVAIVLKLAQASTIMDRRTERPVVLLDDIFSELDAATAARVGGLLSDRYQSFITSPRKEDFPGKIEKYAAFEVAEGAVAAVSADRKQGL